MCLHILKNLEFLHFCEKCIKLSEEQNNTAFSLLSGLVDSKVLHIYLPMFFTDYAAKKLWKIFLIQEPTFAIFVMPHIWYVSYLICFIFDMSHVWYASYLICLIFDMPHIWYDSYLICLLFETAEFSWKSLKLA